MPDLIISSSALRAKSTALAVAQASGYMGEIQVTRYLYSAGTEAYVHELNQLGDDLDRILVVGHNPGMEELLEDLTGSYDRMVTAALALVDLPIDHWRELNEATEGRLVNIWRPKELDPAR